MPEMCERLQAEFQGGSTALPEVSVKTKQPRKGEVRMKLIRMNEVVAEDVRWLWYPYIPCGKITLVQGDPGDGKTTFVLAVAALLTRGQPMPECTEHSPPEKVIYQTAEDGLADTIRPRLDRVGADCENIIVIDESEQALSFSDDRIEQAIAETAAKLFILDPLQAYLGEDVDMHRANEMRPRLKALSDVAERTGCAVVLIGHMNKMSGTKGLYRGLGSIDIAAAARSILLIGRHGEDNSGRVMAHLKSNLAPEGSSIAFNLDGDNGFEWIGACAVSIDEILYASSSAPAKKDTKEQLAVTLITEYLRDGVVATTEIFARLAEKGIGKRTAENAKQRMNIRAYPKGGKWYWSLY
jgi:RecA/RadA recombinase